MMLLLDVATGNTWMKTAIYSKRLLFSGPKNNAASYGLLSKLEKIFNVEKLRVCMMEKRGQQREVTDYLIIF